MEKSQLLARISKLAALAHSDDLHLYSLSEATITEIKSSLDALTEEYISTYC